jgi:hypothetical protein
VGSGTRPVQTKLLLKIQKNNDRKGKKLTIGPGLTIRGAEVQFGQRAVEAEPMEGPRMLLTLLKILTKV